MSRYPALFGLFLLLGCESGSHPQSWAVDDRTRLEFDLGEAADTEEAEGRVAYRLESGLVVTLQAIPVEDDAATESRTPRSVARALSTRIELGERDGELLLSDCALDHVEAECVDGWIVSNEREYSRHGAVVAVGETIVWFDVAGPRQSSDRARDRARAMLRSLRAHQGGQGDA